MPDDDMLPLDLPRDDEEVVESPLLKIPNAGNAQAIARARQVAKFKGDQRGDFWRKVMGDKLGRMVMWEILTSMGTFVDRFASTPAGFSCPEATWFQAGEKATGQRLYQTLMLHDHAGVYTMHCECDGYFITNANKPPKRKRQDG